MEWILKQKTHEIKSQGGGSGYNLRNMTIAEHVIMEPKVQKFKSFLTHHHPKAPTPPPNTRSYPSVQRRLEPHQLRDRVTTLPCTMTSSRHDQVDVDNGVVRGVMEVGLLLG